MSLLDNLLQSTVLTVEAGVSLIAGASHINEHSRVADNGLWSEHITSFNTQMLVTFCPNEQNKKHDQSRSVNNHYYHKK